MMNYTSAVLKKTTFLANVRSHVKLYALQICVHQVLITKNAHFGARRGKNFITVSHTLFTPAWWEASTGSLLCEIVVFSTIYYYRPKRAKVSTADGK